MTTPAVPREMTRFTTLVVLVAALWHLLTVISPPRQAPPRDTAGRDYASYHYALEVAQQGDDPWDKRALDAAAQSDGTRRSVHPYLYPPPFLLTVAWSAPLSLSTGFAVWSVLQEVALLAALLGLVGWWRPVAPQALAALAVAFALAYPVTYGAELGQANALVLALLVGGVAVRARRPELGGALIGLACMLKMAPALLVGWLALRRDGRALVGVAAAVGAATMLSGLVVGWDSHLRFYTEVLPSLGAGTYNGLTIKLGMFGNHSLPNLAHQLFPSGSEVALSPAARAVSFVVGWGGVAALAWRFRHPPADRVAEIAQVCAVWVTMLFIPAYTYSHHFIVAIPAVVWSAVVIQRGDLSWRWAGPVAASAAVLLYPLPHMKRLAMWLGSPGDPLYWMVQEAPFVALCTLVLAMAYVGGRSDASRPPAPRPAA